MSGRMCGVSFLHACVLGLVRVTDLKLHLRHSYSIHPDPTSLFSSPKLAYTETY
jgi:hypothetical protein